MKFRIGSANTFAFALIESKANVRRLVLHRLAILGRMYSFFDKATEGQGRNSFRDFMFDRLLVIGAFCI